MPSATTIQRQDSRRATCSSIRSTTRRIRQRDSQGVPAMIESGAGNAPAGPPEAIAPPHVRYSGFWRRVGASVIDALILGLIGIPITILFADVLVRAGT